MPYASAIAFIGGGNMAGALIGGLLRSGRLPEQVIVVEPNAEQRDRLMREYGVRAIAQADPTLAHASMVVWAVKPQLFREAAVPCAPHVKQALHLSVMAGIRTDAIAQAVGSDRVVRAMPNTPALIGQGIAGLFARDAVRPGERESVEIVLKPTGQLLWVERESDLDAVTALSGSGPAYVFLFIEALIDAAQQMGLSAEQGQALAMSTFAGATALAQQSSESPATLRARVTSRGGTTHAALEAMREADVQGAIVRAVKAAQQRAAELGDEFGR
jgi:pyrroline-5-carboxylate reductase